MPVQKFRTFDEAERALATRRQAAAYADPASWMASLWAFAATLTAPIGFRGVRKYRSIDEANEDRRRMTLARRRERPR